MKHHIEASPCFFAKNHKSFMELGIKKPDKIWPQDGTKAKSREIDYRNLF